MLADRDQIVRLQSEGKVRGHGNMAQCWLVCH